MKKAVYYTLYFIIAAIFLTRAPVVYDNYRAEGKNLNIEKIYLLDEARNLTPVIFPAAGKKSVAIFWASWCGPCSIELGRINKAIMSKEIKNDNIYAINIEDDLISTTNAMIEKKYLFKTYIDQDQNIIRALNITSTPTVAFIDENGIIKWKSTGVSPTLIEKMNNFLN